MDVETYIEFIHEQCILAMYKEGREPYVVLREEMKRLEIERNKCNV